MTKFDYFSYTNSLSYARIRRRRAIRNIIIIGMCMILIVIITSILATRNAEMMNNKENIIANFKKSVVEYKETKLKDTNTPQCINGRMVIIINGVTYYAGSINSWGDVIGGECE